MIFPIGDAPNPPGFRAWVTWLLILANVGIHLLLTLPRSVLRADPADPRVDAYVRALPQLLTQGPDPGAALARITQGDLFLFAHGFKPAAPAALDLLTTMFLHGGIMHLAGNMLFLWIYGDNVEHRLGRLPYLLAWLGTGLAGTLGFWAFAGDSMVPLVGASGAISGVLGFYFVLFPANRVRLLFALPPFFFRELQVSARLVLGAFVVFDNLVPWLFAQTGSGVAHGAHLGGFAAGALLGLGVSRSGLGLARGRAGNHASAAALRAALTSGDRDEVVLLAETLDPAARAALPAAEALQVAAWLANAGQPAAALGWLRGRPALGQDPVLAARASLLTGRVLVEQGHPSAAIPHLNRAARQQEDPAVARAAQVILARLGG